MHSVRFSIIFLLSSAVPFFAKTINIPADYQTIQQGIDSSAHGDTILVSTGTYYENINFNGKNIVLGSLFITTGDTSFISQTVIDGNKQGTVVTFESGEDSTTVLSGFTITNGYIEGSPELTNTAAGIVCKNESGPILEHLYVYKNETKGHEYYLGGGAFCGDRSNPKFLNIVFDQNSTNYSENSGGGILCRDSSNVSIVNCILKNNNGYDGGGISCMNAFLQIKDCFLNNNRSYSGGAVMGFRSTIQMNNIDMVNNRAVRGGGLYSRDSKSHLTDVKIQNNYATALGGGQGAGLYAIESNLFLENCKISENIVETFSDKPYGAGIYLGRETKATILHSIIEENSSNGEGGGISCFNVASLSLEDVVIQRNFALHGGGGISLWDSRINLKNTTIRRNVTHSAAGGIYLQNGSTITFDKEHLSSIYMNKAPTRGSDLGFLGDHDPIEAVLDTFTFSNPTDHQIFPVEAINLTFSHAQIIPQRSDLFVAPFGSDSNSGLSSSQPLQTINHAIFMSDADSLHPITINISPGTYSKTKTNEEFPLFVPSYVSIMGNDMENTILDGEGERSLIRLNSVKEVTLRNMTIQNGFAIEAGGIYCSRGQAITFNNLLIKNNIAEKLGGAGVKIWDDFYNDLPNDNIILNNVLIVANKCLSRTSASYSGGMDIGNVDIKLINTTIAHNTSESSSDEEYSGGLSIWKDANVKIVNSIIAFNKPHNIKVIGDTKVHFAYSDIEGGTDEIVDDSDSTIIWLTANIEVDPHFLGGEPFSYRLSKHSPCIDAGTTFFEWDGDTLLNLSQGQYFGSAPDMGMFEFDPATQLESIEKQPTEFKLEHNYPNPFNAQTTILYNVPQPSFIKLAIYNTKGQVVHVLVDEHIPAGSHKTTWNGSMLSSGLYFCKLSAEYGTVVKKLLLVK